MRILDWLRLGLWGLVLAVGLGGRARAAEPPATVKQVPVQGTGTGVTMDVKLKSSTVKMGQSSSPSWIVEMTVANYTDVDAPLGDSLVILDTAAGSDQAVGLYIARTRRTGSPQLKQFLNRYDLTWGIEVEEGQWNLWPLAAVPGMSITSTNSFLLALSSPDVKSFSGGGYPSVRAKSQYTLREEVLGPVGPKGDRGFVVVIPPMIRAAAGKSQPVFRFANKTFLKTASEVIPVAAPGLIALVDDGSQPTWKRRFALNWLAESFFVTAVPVLTRLASQVGSPASLRQAAILNLGVNTYRPAVPMLLSSLARAGDSLAKAILIEALGDIGDPAAAAPVRAFLESDDHALQLTAIRNSGKLKDDAATASLVTLGRSASDEQIQRASGTALAAMGTPAAWTGLRGIAADVKAGFQARRVAILAIGEKKDQSGLPTLVEIAGRPGEAGGIVLNAIDALSHFSSPDALAALQMVSRSKDRGQAQNAIEALLKTKTTDGQKMVIEFIEQSDFPYRGAAMEQLASARVRAAIPSLKTVLTDGTAAPGDRRSAFDAIAAMDSTRLDARDRDALWDVFRATKERFEAERIADSLIKSGFRSQDAVQVLIEGLDEQHNAAWFANVKLLRHLTKQSFGPKDEYSGDSKTRALEFEQWKQWWKQRNP